MSDQPKEGQPANPVPAEIPHQVAKLLQDHAEHFFCLAAFPEAKPENEENSDPENGDSEEEAYHIVMMVKGDMHIFGASIGKKFLEAKTKDLAMSHMSLAQAADEIADSARDIMKEGLFEKVINHSPLGKILQDAIKGMYDHSSKSNGQEKKE